MWINPLSGNRFLSGNRAGLWGLLVLLAGLTGCAGTTNQASPWYIIPPGSEVELLQPLTVSPGKARVFLQAGKAGSLAGVNRFDPSCNFEVRSVDDTTRIIVPGRIRLESVNATTEEIVARPALAEAGFIKVSKTDSSGLPDIMHVVHFRAQSTENPDLLRFSCRGGINQPAWALPASLAEIRAALGDHARIHLADS